MPVEKSAGAVIFRRGKHDSVEEILYLLLNYEAGHWDFPKGNIEKGEKTEETIRREITEETGIEGIGFTSGFKEVIHYVYQWEGKLVNKWVVYLLAETQEDKVKVSFEHTGFIWLPFDEALQKITFAASREVLRKANDVLLSRALRKQ